jgi:hypothetical protein
MQPLQKPPLCIITEKKTKCFDCHWINLHPCLQPFKKAAAVLKGAPFQHLLSTFPAPFPEAKFMSLQLTVSLRFLGIILRVLRLEVLLNYREGGYGFLSGFLPFSFTVYSN